LTHDVLAALLRGKVALKDVVHYNTAAPMAMELLEWGKMKGYLNELGVERKKPPWLGGTA